MVTEREWYKGAQADPDHVFISDPYVDEQSGGICITLAKATYHNGQVAGVVGMDMYMDNLVSLMEKSYQKNSYVFLGIIVVLNLLIFIIANMIAQKDLEKKVSVLFRPLESISGKMTKVAEGDLSVVFDEEKNSMEIERLTDSINETLASLKHYIGSISDTVTAISDKNLTVSVDGEFKGTYVQSKEHMDAIEEFVSNQQKAIEEVNEELKAISPLITVTDAT